MALNKIFASTQELHRERPVPAGTVAGTPLLSGSRPAVTLTDAGGSTRTETLADGTVVTYPSGGVGNLEDHASLAFDGTWEFAVTGALTSTASDVAVYITSGGVLTLTSSGNTLFGHTDYPRDFRKEAGRAPVKIGA